MKRRRVDHERRVLFMILAGGLAGVVSCLLILWLGDYSPKVRWTLTVFVAGSWIAFAFAARERFVRPLQILSNLMAAVREGDFSIRARGAGIGDALGEVFLEINALAAVLHEQRLGALEASALLGKVMSEIDVAVFAFDGEERLRLVNRAGERLLTQPHERLLGRTAGELGLDASLRARGAGDDGPAILDLSFPGRSSARWEVRRGHFRQGGLVHTLLVLSDVSRALREEERQAWQRLIRVIGHELNNSIAPIKSIAGSLESLLNRETLPDDWRDDARRGLSIIAARSESLGRFMDAYARLARLPAPSFREVEVEPLVRRVVGLETRVAVQVRPGPATVIRADGDQIEQALINLVRNAVDACAETGGGVVVSWSHDRARPSGTRMVGASASGRRIGLAGPVGAAIDAGTEAGILEVRVEDEGPGLPSVANLFVPFFTTKQHGSGIGLVLSRQIAEAHGGTLTLENGRAGAVARLRLPLGG